MSNQTTSQVVSATLQETSTAIVSLASKAEAAHKVTQGGAVGSFLASLSQSDIGFYVSITIAIGGFLMNWHYQRKGFRLKQLYYAKHGVEDATEGEPS
jgi:hypothetical protein